MILVYDTPHATSLSIINKPLTETSSGANVLLGMLTGHGASGLIFATSLIRGTVVCSSSLPRLLRPYLYILGVVMRPRAGCACDLGLGRRRGEELS